MTTKKHESGSSSNVTSREGSACRNSTSTDSLYDAPEPINTKACGLGIVFPPEEASIDSAEEDDTSYISHIPMSYYLNAGNWPPPNSTAQHSAASSYTLPETVKISPFNVGLAFEGAPSDPGPDTPQTAWPRNIGWDFVKDSPKQPNQPARQSDDELKLKLPKFPAPVRSTDAGPTISKKKATNKGNGASFHSPASKNGHQGTYSNQSTSALTNIYRDAKEIYMAGPKGEGYKLWNSVQQLRKQQKATKHSQLPTKQQRPPPPPRPLPPVALGVTRKVTIEDRFSDQPSPIAIPRPPAGDIRRAATPASQDAFGKTQANSVETHGRDPSALTIQVGASPHVHQDAQETVVNYTKPRKPQAPQLFPAPKTKEQIRRRSLGKGGLPPPPVPTSPIRTKGKYVAIGGEAAQRNDPVKSKLLPPLPQSQLQPGRSSDAVGSNVSLAPSFVSSGPTLIGETESTEPTYQGNVHDRFRELDDRVTERPRQVQRVKDDKTKQSWLSRFFDTLCTVEDSDPHQQTPNQPTAKQPANKKPSSKQKPISKLDISYPRPMYVPTDHPSANISAVSGGVGGPAAAMSLSRHEEEEREKKKKKKEEEEVSNGTYSFPVEKGMPSQRFWSDVIQRKRNDLDASFGCQGISTMDEGVEGRFRRASISSVRKSLVPRPLFSGSGRL